MRGRAALAIRRYDQDVPEIPYRFGHGQNPRRRDAVVVRNENERLSTRSFARHGPLRLPAFVGATGFEPATPCPPDRCANQAAPRPEKFDGGNNMPRPKGQLRTSSPLQAQ